jgi:hypothetical protein
MTTENNKLIAEFMGWDSNSTKTVYYEPTDMVQGIGGFTLENLPFDNWNWLMQVVEKIKPLNKNGNHHYLRLMNMTLIEALNIDYLYSNVVEFIKWYNENKI